MNFTRRTFLRIGGGGLGTGIAGLGYSTLIEPARISLERIDIPLPRLPAALEGLRLVVLSDFHLHPFTTLAHIQKAIDLANSLRPDVLVLLGDYVDSDVEAIYELAPALAGANAETTPKPRQTGFWRSG